MTLPFLAPELLSLQMSWSLLELLSHAEGPRADCDDCGLNFEPAGSKNQILVVPRDTAPLGRAATHVVKTFAAEVVA